MANDYARDGAMSTNSRRSNSLPQVRSGPIITGGALAAAGALIALAGFAIGSSHLVAATRRWIREMEVPPSELAKVQWSKAKSAAAAGTAAWQNGVQASEGAHT
jgi:hypothetical protein